MLLVERKACCHVANAFLSRLELIWSISRLKISKMSKKCGFLAKSSKSKWVKQKQYHVTRQICFGCVSHNNYVTNRDGKTLPMLIFHQLLCSN